MFAVRSYLDGLVYRPLTSNGTVKLILILSLGDERLSFPIKTNDTPELNENGRSGNHLYAASSVLFLCSLSACGKRLQESE